MGTVTPIVKVLTLKISLLFPLCMKLYLLKFCAYQKYLISKIIEYCLHLLVEEVELSEVSYLNNGRC